ncbi:TonB-dependent receptor family protein [Methylobacterium mesophilicum]|uniref:TonB-dependent receptor family protein n=1 Tax=Methylobacterium mesophilicum TaxID=39956 RepID=UPI001EE1AF19|nr:TonB-dependent receptor [Methylobacterium mesophilicum]
MIRHRAACGVIALLAASPLCTGAGAAPATRPLVLEELSVVGDAHPPTGQPAASPLMDDRDRPIREPAGAPTTRLGAIANRPAADIGQVLIDSPGVTIRQGTGGRDVIVSIRGSNARSTGTNRNIVVVEDGFSLTQPDGVSRFDLTDPHAYSRIDVFRGPQSALFGNYATGGAIAFQTRTGRKIDGYEIGTDAGSFGYLNTYFTVGGASGPFEISLFASDVRANGYQDHSSYDTQTINLLANYTPTPDNRFTLKVIDNTLDANLAARSSLAQYRINPYQRGCAAAATAAPGCTTVAYFVNGAFGPTAAVTASEAALLRADQRSVVAARWEHDLDASTTMRTQLGFDERAFNQPFTTAAPRGSYPAWNVLTDLRRQDTLFGLPAVGYAALTYNTIDGHAAIFNRVPYGGPRLGALIGDQRTVQDNLGGRARIELTLGEHWTAVAGFGVERTAITGRNDTFSTSAAGTVGTVVRVDRSFLNVAPELALVFSPAREWQVRGRAAVGYGTPAATNLFITPAGQPGDNVQLQAQRNLGFDLAVNWSPAPDLQLSVTGFYELFRNELLSQSPGAGLLPYVFNAPASEHRGIEIGGRWISRDGWRATLAYTHDDQVYTNFVERLSAGTRAARFDRAGNHIPGVPTDAALIRLGYEQTDGPWAGVGLFVEAVSQSSFFIDNANLLKAAGFAVVNLNLHYDRALTSAADTGFARRLSLYLELRNLLDRVYTNSAQNLADTINANTGVQNGAGILAQTTGSIFAGAPRTLIGGMKLAF